MATKKREMMNRGAWTGEEDRKLAEAIEIHGPKKWKTIAIKAGLNRCGKSCRLRWMNYLRPNIKRGNISDQEEDLIVRLHKLLGNRWSLIAGRLPGRTDNEIKNYWNSHLSKKIKQKCENNNVNNKDGEESKAIVDETKSLNNGGENKNEEDEEEEEESLLSSSTTSATANGFNVDEFFDFSNEDPLNLEWINRFVET